MCYTSIKGLKMNASQKKFMDKAKKNGLSVEEQNNKMEAKSQRAKNRDNRSVSITVNTSKKKK